MCGRMSVSVRVCVHACVCASVCVSVSACIHVSHVLYATLCLDDSHSCMPDWQRGIQGFYSELKASFFSNQKTSNRSCSIGSLQAVKP